MSDALACPKCAARPTVVRDSRANPRPVANVRRRRECTGCGHRFTTVEMVNDVDLDQLIDLRPLLPVHRGLIRQLTSALVPSEAVHG